MANLEYGFSPEPLSCYADHSNFDYYYKREDRVPKKGQPWDLFNSWGQERLLLMKQDGKTKAVSSRIPMRYTATSCTLPSMPPNNVVAKDFLNPALQVLQEQRELTQMKEALLYRIPMAKRKTMNYGKHLTEVRCRAKELLHQLKKENVSSVQLSSAESDDSDSDEQVDIIKKKSRGEGSSDDLSPDPGDACLQKEITYFTQECPLVQRVLCDFHNDSRLFSEVQVPMLPYDYLGGCLGCTRTADTTYIAHATGSQMSEVTVKQLSDRRWPKEMQSIGHYNNGDTVRQVALQAYGSEILCSVRSSQGLALCKTADGTTLPRDVIKQPNIIHTSLSPHFPESIYVQDDSIYRWTESGQSMLLQSDWTPRFPSVGTLQTVHYSCHPRQLVMTDPTVCSLYDMRSSTCVDLFEVPSNNLLQKDELLVTSMHSKDFTHHILAHHTLLTVDERFTKYPMLYQVLPCLAQPMLIDSLQLNGNTDLVVISCPTNQETFAMVIDTIHSIIRSTPIWQCSQPSDILYFNDTKPPVSDRLALDKRLNSGLLGLTASRCNDEDFTVHMLSGQGDLFEQTYKKSVETGFCDRTKSAGPVLESGSISADVREHCLAWYDVIEGQQVEECDEELLSEALVVPKDDLLPAREGCAVCRGQTQGVTDSSFDGFPCISCGLTLEQSAKFIDDHRRGNYCDFHIEALSDPLTLLNYDPVGEAGSDPNSNLLLKLWNNEDIAEELAVRNKEWDERRETLAKQGREGAQGSEDLDALSSLSGMPNKDGFLRAGSTSGHSKASTRNFKSVSEQPGFMSPRTRFRGDSDAESNHSGAAFFTPAFGSQWTGESSSFQATPASQRKSKGKKMKGF